MNTSLGFHSIAVWAAAQADLLEPRYVRPICSTPRRVDEDPDVRAKLRAADNPEPERAAALKQPEKPAEPEPAAAVFKPGDKVRWIASPEYGIGTVISLPDGFVHAQFDRYGDGYFKQSDDEERLEFALADPDRVLP